MNNDEESNSLWKRCLACTGTIMAIIGGGLFLTLLGFNYYAALLWNTTSCNIVIGFNSRIWILLYASVELSAIICVGHAYHVTNKKNRARSQAEDDYDRLDSKKKNQCINLD